MNTDQIAQVQHINNQTRYRTLQNKLERVLKQKETFSHSISTWLLLQQRGTPETRWFRQSVNSSVSHMISNKYPDTPINSLPLLTTVQTVKVKNWLTCTAANDTANIASKMGISPACFCIIEVYFKLPSEPARLLNAVSRESVNNFMRSRKWFRNAFSRKVVYGTVVKVKQKQNSPKLFLSVNFTLICPKRKASRDAKSSEHAAFKIHHSIMENLHVSQEVRLLLFNIPLLSTPPAIHMDSLYALSLSPLYSDPGDLRSINIAMAHSSTRPKLRARLWESSHALLLQVLLKKKKMSEYISACLLTTTAWADLSDGSGEQVEWKEGKKRGRKERKKEKKMEGSGGETEKLKKKISPWRRDDRFLGARHGIFGFA